TAAGFTYAWDFGDGATSTQAAPAHAYTAAGTYAVKLTVTDKDGGATTAATTATVQAIATRPAAVFTNGGPAPEGGTATVSFGSQAGGTGPYTYSYDFNNDGVFEISNSTQASATVPAQYLADGPATQVVHGRITDATGASADYTTSIPITNVPPAVTLRISLPGTSPAAGSAINFAATVPHPS